MSEWQEVTLDEIAEINPKEKLSKGCLAHKISMENLFPFCKKVSGKSLEPFNGGTKFRNGDTLIARITPCLENGKTAYVDVLNDGEIGFGSTEYIVLREKPKKSYSQYLYYFARSDFFRGIAIASMTGSSGRQRVQTDVVRNYLFEFPDYEEQQAIASVLSSLDDKIDLLHRQNKTLESIAETLFRQWFIEKAQSNWNEVELSKIANVQNGYAFSSKDYTQQQQDVYEVLKMGHINKDSTLKFNPKRDFVNREKKLCKFVLEKDDIVLAMTDMKDNVIILGVPALVDKNDKYVLNQRVARITLNNKDFLISQYLLFLQLKNREFIEVLQSKANSGVQVNLSTQVIKDSKIIVPPFELQQKILPLVDDVYTRVNLNREQIQTLEKLRDTLLPKLMSGEVRVKYSN